MNDCLFCEIIDGQLESRIVYEDHDVLAILDLFPSTKGHTLVIPKKHITNCLDATAEESAMLMQKASMIAKGLVKALDAKGLNILINNEPIAGQVIPHYHIHLIPRYNGKELILTTDLDAKASLDETYNLIKANLKV